MLENGIIKEFNVLLNYQALGRIIKAFIQTSGLSPFRLSA